jgi:hypothetical protein
MIFCLYFWISGFHHAALAAEGVLAMTEKTVGMTLLGVCHTPLPNVDIDNGFTRHSMDATPDGQEKK